MHLANKPPFKNHLITAILAALFSINNPVYAESPDPEHTAHHAQNSMDWSGIYNGFLPCADCVGIKTSLALNANNSYILITQNTGKSPREYVEKGKFAWVDTSNTIILTPRNSTSTRQYLIGENILTQLDGDGNKVSGKDAERYILRRKEMTSSESASPSHGGH
jgi:copper homeostasis protein (lipoprotein)